jgi:hypothetical protein
MSCDGVNELYIKNMNGKSILEFILQLQLNIEHCET